MIPGEVMPKDGEIELNAGREAITLMVANTGDRPVQVGSHFHFAEANPGLDFDRAAARGLSVADYLAGANLLKREVTVDDVAAAFVSLAKARKTTGAVHTVDGGNIAAAPR